LIARPEPTFYVDESIFSNALVAELTAAGIAFDRVGLTVPLGAPDEVWLSHCGKHSYLALTRDQRIRYRALEKQALIDHGVACFTFTQGQATATQVRNAHRRTGAEDGGDRRQPIAAASLHIWPDRGACEGDVAKRPRIEVGGAQPTAGQPLLDLASLLPSAEGCPKNAKGGTATKVSVGSSPWEARPRRTQIE